MNYLKSSHTSSLGTCLSNHADLLRGTIPGSTPDIIMFQLSAFQCVLQPVNCTVDFIYCSHIFKALGALDTRTHPWTCVRAILIDPCLLTFCAA